MKKTMKDLDKLAEVCDRAWGTGRLGVFGQLNQTYREKIRECYKKAGDNSMRPGELKIKVMDLVEDFEKDFTARYPKVFREKYIYGIQELLGDKEDLIDKEKEEEINDFVSEFETFINKTKYNFGIDSLFVDYQVRAEEILLWLAKLK